MSQEPEPVLLTLDHADDGQRLDKVLAAKCPQFSRAEIQRWIELGRVELGGVIASRKTKSVGGAEATVRPAPPELPNAQPQDIPLEVLFEDDHVLVLNKQAGLVVHPAPGHPDGTLVNAVLHHAKVQGGSDPLRPGIVHRLDKDTSGVMVVAKTPRAHEALVDGFSAHRIERSYLAIAVGPTPQAVTFDTFHGRHHSDRKKFSSKVQRGKRAVTHVETIERLHGAALVRCTLETGRTHQIRVHLTDHGHPVLGDPVYGRSIADPRLRGVGQTLGRQALHAAVLGFLHPVSAEPMRFEHHLPADMTHALNALRNE